MKDKPVEIQLKLDFETQYKIQYIANKNKISVNKLVENWIIKYEKEQQKTGG